MAAGLPPGSDDDPKVVAIQLAPRERVLSARWQQQLRVTARYSDGHSEDVTTLAKFQTNNEALAAVSDAGLVTAGDVPGQVAVMASFMGAVDVFRALIPRAATNKAVGNSSYPAEQNFIDHLVYEQLRKLNI